MADEAAKDYFAGLVDGHRDGESCRQNDWDMALDEILPTSVKSDPDAVADHIATLEGMVRRLLYGWFDGGYEWVKKDSASPTGAMFRVPMSEAEVLILKEM